MFYPYRHGLGCHCDPCWREHLGDLVRRARDARPDENPVFHLFNGIEADEVMRQMARTAPGKPYSIGWVFGWNVYNGDPGDEDDGAASRMSVL